MALTTNSPLNSQPLCQRRDSVTPNPNNEFQPCCGLLPGYQPFPRRRLWRYCMHPSPPDAPFLLQAQVEPCRSSIIQVTLADPEHQIMPLIPVRRPIQIAVAIHRINRVMQTQPDIVSVDIRHKFSTFACKWNYRHQRRRTRQWMRAAILNPPDGTQGKAIAIQQLRADGTRSCW